MYDDDGDGIGVIFFAVFCFWGFATPAMIRNLLLLLLLLTFRFLPGILGFLGLVLFIFWFC